MLDVWPHQRANSKANAIAARTHPSTVEGTEHRTLGSTHPVLNVWTHQGANGFTFGRSDEVLDMRPNERADALFDVRPYARSNTLSIVPTDKVAFYRAVERTIDWTVNRTDAGAYGRTKHRADD